jgi:hypothetical protein
MPGVSVFRAHGRTSRDISIRTASPWLTTILVAMAASCSTASTKVDSMGDGSVDRAEIGTGPADCHRPLTDHGPFGDCPATFADDGWRTNVCSFVSGTFMPLVTERTCNGYRVRSFAFGTHSWSCYYDATALTLVAADYTDDTPDLCGDTSAYEVLGDIPPGKCTATASEDMPCGPLDAGGQ